MPIEDIAPFVIGFGLVVVLPIVAIMARHQRHMAELLNRGAYSDQTAHLVARIDQLQSEIVAMKDRQNELILSLESRRPPPEVQQRIGE